MIRLTFARVAVHREKEMVCWSLPESSAVRILRQVHLIGIKGHAAE